MKQSITVIFSIVLSATYQLSAMEVSCSQQAAAKQNLLEQAAQHITSDNDTRLGALLRQVSGDTYSWSEINTPIDDEGNTLLHKAMHRYNLIYSVKDCFVPLEKMIDMPTSLIKKEFPMLRFSLQGCCTIQEAQKFKHILCSILKRNQNPDYLDDAQIEELVKQFRSIPYMDLCEYAEDDIAFVRSTYTKVYAKALSSLDESDEACLYMSMACVYSFYAKLPPEQLKHIIHYLNTGTSFEHIVSPVRSMIYSLLIFGANPRAKNAQSKPALPLDRFQNLIEKAEEYHFIRNLFNDTPR